MAADDEPARPYRENPKGSASLISLVFFWWMEKVLRLGSKKTLDSSDLFPLLPEDQSNKLVESLGAKWTEERGYSAHVGRTPRLWRAFLHFVPRRSYLTLIVFRLLVSVSYVMLPLLTWFFLRNLSDVTSSDHVTAWLYILCLGVAALVRALVVTHANYFCDLWGLRLKVAAIGLVYRKVLVVTRCGLGTFSGGNTVNMVSNDAARLEKAALALGWLFSAPLEIIASVCLLWLLIGWQALFGAVLFLVLILYVTLMGKASAKLHGRAAAITDKRLALINESICGIQTVKMSAWEEIFRSKIKSLRKDEIKWVRLRGAILSSFSALFFTVTPVATMLSVMVMIFSGKHAQASDIFTLFMALSVIKVSVCKCLADSTRYLADVHVSLQRIQAFLEHDVSYASEEQKVVYSGPVHKPSSSVRKSQARHHASVPPQFARPTHKRMAGSVIEEDQVAGTPVLLRRRRLSTNVDLKHFSPRVTMEGISCQWNEHSKQKTLANISLKVPDKQLVILTGQSGSGKSSLLLSILEELPLSSGKLVSAGRIAYVSQTPWVFSGTVRDNILFGRPYNEARYQQALRSCDLHKDVFYMRHGDVTNVGQHGAGLSGGQRARLALARAVYADADVYLLDDPLSALDARVAKHVFNNCICEALTGRLRLLATHQVQYLNCADHIVMLQHGTIAYQGDYQGLETSGLLAAELELAHGKVESMTSAEEEMLLPRRRFTSITDDFEPSQEDAECLDREERETGSVSWQLYWRYFRSSMQPALIALMALFFVTVQVCIMASSWWLSRMADMSLGQQTQAHTVAVYCSLVLGAVALTTCASFCFYYTSLRASKKLHDKMMAAVLKSPMSFFDNNPSGRIMNRFSKDIGVMDDLLPARMLRLLQFSLYSMCAILVPAVANYWILIALVPMAAVFVYYGLFYLKSSREFKRLEAIKCSPVYSHISETVAGLEIIRSNSMEANFLCDFHRCQDENTQAYFMVVSSSRWLGVRLDSTCALFVTAVAIGALLIVESPAVAGLSLSFAMESLQSIQSTLRLTAEVENMMTAVERVMGYTALDAEPGYTINTEPPQSWPTQGSLELKQVSLVYVEDGPRVLKELNVNIADKEKVGVVGRTGAGKSSIAAALFRMPQPEGQVLVDALDVSTLNLQTSRQAIAAISQNPVLFSGSLRSNLDPFSRFADADLWDALEQVQLKDWIEELPGQLHFTLKESGANFSVGQRQLICLARALLQKTKIVVIDEATASVDFKTDQLIQQVIRNKFSSCTVLTVAHRLNTIIDYDKVLVLHRGRIVEFDKPEVLLGKSNGYFAEMVKYHNEALSE